MNTRGFTLIELLVTMALISALTAIAVPQYKHYRQKAFDTRALSDLRNSALAQEAYFLEYETYLSCSDAACTQLPGIVAVSRGVTLSWQGNADSYVGSARHVQGTGRAYAWDSDRGGLLEGPSAG